MAPTLYDVLGVRRDASAEQVRAAYLAKAREAHPDRWIDASPGEQASAERRMKDLTEAWRVLGDVGRRRRYDHELGGDARARAVRIDEQRFATRTDGTMPEDEGPADALTRLVRVLPWLAMLAVLGIIFVFTAYALTGDSTGGRCVDGDGTTVSCSTTGARTVVTEVPPTARCPAGTEALVTQLDPNKLCLKG